MSDQPAAGTGVRLAAADARELAELLVFLRDWLTDSDDTELLVASRNASPAAPEPTLCPSCSSR
jgi:hypothetical protein